MTHAMAATAAAALSSRFLEDQAIRIAQRQRDRFAWLIERFGPPLLWDCQTSIGDARLIAVTEPLAGPKADRLYRALHGHTIVVVFYSENPGFDFLKSKLKDFGTIGASPHDGPHEMWWGGLKWAETLAACHKIQEPLIVSCYPRDTDAAIARPLKHSLRSLQLDNLIAPVKTRTPGKLHGAEKAAFIRDVRKSHRRPLLWVEPDARLEVFPSLVSKIDFDFAVHRWNRWEMSTRTLGFGAGDVVDELLQVWRDLAFAHDKVWDGYVLDQAWSLVSSQRPLDTVWLPRSYHAARDEQTVQRTPVVIHDVGTTLRDLGEPHGFPKHLVSARRASRVGAPEAAVVLKSAHDGHNPVTVILSDIQAAKARDVANTVDAIVSAFHDDPAGFSHLELSLCCWKQDADAAAAVATTANNRILQLTPSKMPRRDLFRRFADMPEHHFNIVPDSGPAALS